VTRGRTLRSLLVHNSKEVLYDYRMTSTRKPRKSDPRPSVALLYLRVSTGRQADSGLSLEQQERQLVAAATEAGYTETVVMREEGRSGKSLKGRPVLAEALDLLARGEADALYTSKMDRLARSARDTLTVLDAANKQGWRLVSLDLGLDSKTPVGRMVLTVLAATAEMEHERICERHRDWHESKRERGIRWGIDEGPRALLPSKTRERILQMRDSGLSLQAIADTLNEEGVPTARKGARWHKTTVVSVLNSKTSAHLVAAS
jgi:DNA invertase Pin-like site-specific DNA recombinase